MRYKFRGKSVFNSDWWEGSLIVLENGKHYITQDLQTPQERYEKVGYCLSHFDEVYPETVGQFTGLHDKNGKEIYEGDVVKYKNDYNGAYKKTVIKMGKIVINNDLFYALTNTWEIIGNVHDKGEEHE